ncbi:MAG TPA: hypothetical protein VN495_01570 [Candidatus Paceibacterota bacterium]|nr:hypothetical protein [Candidatus Paceibacterota bacterium]
MSRTLVMGVVLAASYLFFTPVASAEYAEPTTACPDPQKWNRLYTNDVEKLGLMERLEAYLLGTQAVEADPAVPLQIEIAATDCPIGGLTVVVRKQPNMTLFNGAYYVPAAHYVIALSVPYLHRGDLSDLTREGTKQVCLIKLSEAEGRMLYGEEPEIQHDLLQCELDAAGVAEDKEYERWLTRLLRREVPEQGQAQKQSGAGLP